MTDILYPAYNNDTAVASIPAIPYRAATPEIPYRAPGTNGPDDPGQAYVPAQAEQQFVPGVEQVAGDPTKSGGVIIESAQWTHTGVAYKYGSVVAAALADYTNYDYNCTATGTGLDNTGHPECTGGINCTTYEVSSLSATFASRSISLGMAGITFFDTYYIPGFATSDSDVSIPPTMKVVTFDTTCNSYCGLQSESSGTQTSENLDEWPYYDRLVNAMVLTYRYTNAPVGFTLNDKLDIFIQSVRERRVYSGDYNGELDSGFLVPNNNNFGLFKGKDLNWPMSRYEELHLSGIQTNTVNQTTDTKVYVRFLRGGRLYEALMPYSSHMVNNATDTAELVGCNYTRHIDGTRNTEYNIEVKINPAPEFSGGQWVIAPGWYPTNATLVEI